MYFTKKILFFILIAFVIYGQEKELMWSNKLLEITESYQYENNETSMLLGPPSVYPERDLVEPHDIYAEGYILHYEKTKRKNAFVVGFPKAINARQIVLGGIFNVGVIDELYILEKSGKYRLVYKNNKLPGKTKFRTFATQIPYLTVYGVKVVVDHSKVNGWNLIKGVGITASDKLTEIKPYFIEDTSHTHEKEVLAEAISSDSCFEFSPKISPDGRTLYFVRECEGHADQDIWVSEMDSTQKWSKAKAAGPPLNNKGHNFVASVSADGTVLLIGNKYNEDGSDAGEGVSMATKDDNGNWKVPKALQIPNYKNTNEHANYFLGGNNKVLLMAIQNDKSVGDLDLYVSLYNDIYDKWSEPKNLGVTINTPYAEDYPYLANDGVTLYFSSKGNIGFGGHDIYVSKRLDDSWTSWTKPQNLGPFINSKSDDKGFSISSQGDHAYFNSAGFDSDLHHMDIYKVDLPRMLRQVPRILMSGRVMDAQDSSKPLRATILVKDTQDKEVAFCFSNPKTGHYAVALDANKPYKIKVDVLGYFALQESLVFRDSLSYIEKNKDFKLSKFLDSGMVMTFQNIGFEYGKSTIREESYEEVKHIALLLKQMKKSKFKISGHTDNIGSSNYNLLLSQQRASSVRDFLMREGVPASRLVYEGIGEEMPIASNDTEEGRAKNRRVEVTLIEKDVYRNKDKPKASSKFRKSKP